MLIRSANQIFRSTTPSMIPNLPPCETGPNLEAIERSVAAKDLPLTFLGLGSSGDHMILNGKGSTGYGRRSCCQRAYETGHCRLVGKDADDLGRPLDLAIKALEQIDRV